MDHVQNMILGAGIAGLGASYALHQRGEQSVIFEKDDTYGGLCGNFIIEGFRFDRFVHFSFSQNEQVQSIFQASSPEIYRHIPEAYNIYKGIWIKHPAQNNLFPLSEQEKAIIIQDFLNRNDPSSVEVNNYEDWLRLQFGDYFAENFPMRYTRKYWMREARDLRTEWVGQRVYQPSVEEVIKGAKTSETPITYYAKEMRYPKYGGYKSFIKSLAEVANIRYNKKVVSIDSVNKVVTFSDNTTVGYDNLYSSIPLKEMVKIVNNVPVQVREAANKLDCTCGYHVSIGLSTTNIPHYLWWYIYDEDNLAARVHSPSMKSPDNAPEGCSSLQMEVYCKEGEYTEQEIKERTVGKIIKLGLIKEEDILFVHLGYEPYANVIFTQPIFESRKVVRDYLSSVGISTIGRFGEWDYLWSDQSLLSGLKI
jgi:protoporphyrinogen oxidase